MDFIAITLPAVCKTWVCFQELSFEANTNLFLQISISYEQLPSAVAEFQIVVVSLS
jgi:hypothetical protein